MYIFTGEATILKIISIPVTPNCCFISKPSIFRVLDHFWKKWGKRVDSFFKVILSVLFHSSGISKTHERNVIFTVCCCYPVTKQCPTLWDSMDCSTPGFPDLHHLPKLVQTHVHWVGDAIQPSHPLSSPSPPAFTLSQHQGLFQCARSSHQATELLQLLHQSFQLIFRVDVL